MITITNGDILRANVEALVCPVNCVGVMGKGLALQFRHEFPDNYVEYARACQTGEMAPGRVYVYSRGTANLPDTPGPTLRYIINFPTKRHWKESSRLEDIETGLESLVAAVKRLDISSVAVPALGCGLGGLKWDTVLPLLASAFHKLPSVYALLFLGE